MRRFGLFGLFLILVAGAGWGHTIVVPPSPGSQTITDITLSASSYLSNGQPGQVVGALGVVVAPSSPAFTGTLQIVNINPPPLPSPPILFALDSTTLPANIVTTGSIPPGNYTVQVTAIQAGLTGSPLQKTFTITSQPTTPQTISVVGTSSTSFTASQPSGQVVGAVLVTMSPVSPTFTGTLSLTGTDAAKFNLTSSTLPANIVTASSLAAGSYSINLVATQSGATGSPFTQPLTITGVAAPQTISSLTLSNSSYNAGQPDGTVVGAVSVAMSPASPAFGGTLALSGTNSSQFRLSSTVLPANLLLNGTGTAGTKSISIIATQAGAIGSPFTQPLTITGNPQSIIAVQLSGTTFTGGAADGTVVGNVGVTMSPTTPAFTGSLALSGPDAARFKLSSTTLPAALQLNGSQPGGNYSVTVTATQAGATGSPFAQAFTIVGSPTPQTIASVTLSGNTFTGGAADGTLIGAISVTMSPSSPAFGGTLSLTGTDAAKFRLSSTTLPANLLLNGSQSSGTYNINIVATQASASNSPFSQAETITGSAPAQTITAVGLSGSAFTGNAPDGTVIGAVSVTMSPTTPPFSGTLSLSGADAAKFRLSSTVLPANLLLNGSQAAGTYHVNIVATQAGATGSPFSQAETITGSTPAQSISSIGLTGTSFAGGAPSGTLVGAVSVVMSPSSPPFSGTLTITGTDAARFQLSSTTLPANLLLNGTQASGSYSINIVATQAGATGSPFPQAFTITGVTVSGVVTTFTFQNDSGSTLAAGTPVPLAQGFRYDDFPSGTYPVIRDATTHTALAGQQWDEWDTWRENGGDGSLRHAAWTIWLPTSVAAGATYQVEFVNATGSYSETSHQALSALCSGPGSHDFKIDLANVRNQDDTVRDSGHAVFRVCDNIANTGRDAPQHLRAGNVVDEYRVRGLFVYATSGNSDPLLYGDCIIDLFTDAADGTSLKDVRHVCFIHNSWEEVAQGSTGNAGNPGPAGFTNDPQIISYVPSVLDGSTTVLDWSNLSATVSSASNPIVPNSPCADGFDGTTTLTIPSSTGNNVWGQNQTVRVSTTGTAVGGLTAGHLYWVYPTGTITSGGSNTTCVQLTNVPQTNTYGGQGALTTSQGSGTTTFTFTAWHGKLESVLLVDSTTDENWATRGSTTRFTRRIYPKLTVAERQYWASTGLWEPLNLSQPTPTVGIIYSQGDYPLYAPFGKGVVIGTGGQGERPDLGYINEFQAQCQVTQTQNDCYLARLFTMGQSTHSYSTIINEATGSVPPLNNGPPTGPGGNGVGGSYTNSITGFTIAPQPHLMWRPYDQLATPLQNVPNSTVQWECGLWAQCGTYVSHMPSFDSYTYMVFGSRQFLDMIYYQANRDLAMRPWGPGVSFRDDIANSNHYYGLALICCQARGSAWSLRDFTYAAALGGDNNYERQLASDYVTENLNYYHQAIGPTSLGLGTNNIYTSIAGPDAPGSWVISDTYITNFIALAQWGMFTMLHAPVEDDWLTTLQRQVEGVCGERMYGSPSSYYCIDYMWAAAVHNGDESPFRGDGMNAVDASDFGNNTQTTCILNAGVVSQCGGVYYTLATGDLIKNTEHAVEAGYTVDQLPGNQWFTIVNPDNNANTFQIQCPIGHAVDATCPTPGGAFTGFTSNGVNLANVYSGGTMNYRPTFDPGTGYARFTYVSYGGNTMELLKISGHDVTQALTKFNARNGPTFYNTSIPSQWWDDTTVIPGLPPIVTYSNQFSTISCFAAPGSVVSSLGLKQGNGNGPSGWSILSQSSAGSGDFAISGNNLVVGPSGITSGNCNSSQAIRVQGTQSGGGTVVGQVNLHINLGLSLSPSSASVACNAAPATHISTITPTGGGAFTCCTAAGGDTTDFAVVGTDIRVGSSGITAGNCGTGQTLTIDATTTP